MLKKIALGGFVLVALALSLSIATATTPSTKSTATPHAPIPQGFCLPPSGRC
jgi:hypothetical protein